MSSIRQPLQRTLTSSNMLIQRKRELIYLIWLNSMEVKLRFHRDLINVVFDRFGRDVMLIPDGSDHFVFTIHAAISPMFLSWIIGFGKKAQVLYPDSVVDACRKLCEEALAQYDRKL